MRLHRPLIAVIVCLSVLASCKKEPLPDPPSATPVFYLRAGAAATALNLEAGNMGYRMEPGFSQDSNGVYVLESTLSNGGCADCYAVRILINDHMTSAPNAPIHIDSALRLGHYLYNDKSLEPSEYSVTMRPVKPLDPTGKYKWTIREAGHPDMFVEDYQFTLHFDARQSYSVSLLFEDASGCQTTHSNVYLLGSGLQPQILAESLSATDLTYSFSPIGTGSAQATYHWDFGDGFSSDQFSETHTYSVIGGSYYTATLTVTDYQQHQTRSTYQIPGTTDPLCLANFVAVITPVPNIKAYSKVTVELTDPTGKVFSTRGFVQPAESEFEVVQIDGYKPAPDNSPTKKYKALFNCVLRNGAEELPLTNAEAVMAVSYK
jgi:hypothetical protein